MNGGELVITICVCCGFFCWSLYGIFACKYDYKRSIVMLDENEEDTQQ